MQYLPAGQIVYTTLSVKPGTVLTPEILGITSEEWDALQKEAIIDLNMPITQDVLLTFSDAEDNTSEPAEETPTSSNDVDLATQDLIALASIVVMAVIFIGLVVSDNSRNHKRRNRANEQSGAKIST